MRIVFALLLSLLSACTVIGSKSFHFKDSGPDEDVDVSHVKDAVPRYDPITKAGNSSPYTVLGKTYHVQFDTKGFRQQGKASWYGKKFHGNKTANGEVYDMFAMTAAHKTLPIPSYVRVTNLKNQRKVVVRVNDRGPFHYGRVIDLSYAAAKKLGIQQAGTGDVLVELVTPNALAKSVDPVRVQAGQSYLQVGAFRVYSSAAELRRRILPLTAHKVLITPISKEGIYRVVIGPIFDAVALRQLETKLSQHALSDTHLVKF